MKNITIFKIFSTLILTTILFFAINSPIVLAADEEYTYEQCSQIDEPQDGATDADHQAIADGDEDQGAVAGESDPADGDEADPEAETSEGFGVGVALPGGQNDFNGFSDWMTAFYEFSIRLGAILTILMLIFSGYRYMTSQGNPSAINEAKDIMIGSLSGFALLLLVNLVINFIGTTNP